MSETNGAGRPHRPSRLAAQADPWAKVLSSGPRIPLSVILAFAALLHVGLAAGGTAVTMFGEIWAWQRGIRDVIAYRLSQYEMDIIKEAPPPEPAPPPPEPEPAPKETPPPQAVPKEAPPPTPAEASKVLTAAPEPDNAPVDLTNAFVQGTGSEYRGGTTSSDGTSKTAVYNPLATPKGVPGGTGTAPVPAPRKDDKSRAPGLLGSTEWNCPWPGEADAEQIDHSYVMIQVKVKADGSPENVSVMQDPGHGFGREARKCAMQKKYQTGLDADGNAVGGMTKPFRVRFDR